MDRGRASLEVPGEGNLISPKSPLERTIRAPQARPITGGGAPGVTPTLGAISPHPPPERPPTSIFRKNAHSALERVFVRKQPKHGRRYYKRGGLRRRASRPRRVHRVGHIGRPSLPLGPLAGYRHRRRACPEHLGSHARPAADRGCGVPARRDARIIASSGFGSSAASSPPASPTAAVASALARSRTRYPQRRLGGGRSVRASPQKDLFRGFAQAGSAGVRGSLADGQDHRSREIRGQSLAATRVPCEPRDAASGDASPKGSACRQLSVLASRFEGRRRGFCGGPVPRDARQRPDGGRRGARSLPCGEALAPRAAGRHIAPRGGVNPLCARPPKGGVANEGNSGVSPRLCSRVHPPAWRGPSAPPASEV